MQGSRDWDYRAENKEAGYVGVRGKATIDAHEKNYTDDVVWHHANYNPETNTARMQLVTDKDHKANQLNKKQALKVHTII